MRDMLPADVERLTAHPLSRRLFKQLCDGYKGCACKVADLDTGQYRHLRTLLELGYVSVEDGLCIVQFTVSSLVRRGYPLW